MMKLKKKKWIYLKLFSKIVQFFRITESVDIVQGLEQMV